MQNFEQFSKAALIEACRRLGLKTGDTGRNSRDYYLQCLMAFPEQGAVEKAILGLSVRGSVFNNPEPEPVVSELVADLPRIAAHPEDIRCIGKRTVKEVFGIGGKLGKMEVEVWNDPDAGSPDPDYKFDKGYLEAVLGAMNCGINIWLYGPAGTGKTEFVKNMAAYLGRAFYRVSFDSAMERYEYIGGERARNGSTVWQDGIIIQAMTRKGAIVLLDEVGFARPEYTSPLHPILEPNGKVTITETGRVVSKAEGVLFFAADNSNGTGDATGAYVGVKQQNRAFTSRFGVFVNITYLEPDQEADVLVLRSKCNPELAGEIVKFLNICRQASATSMIEEAPSMREAIAIAGLISKGMSVRMAFTVSMANRVSAENGEQLQQLFKQNVDEDLWEAAASGNMAKRAAELEAERAAAAAAAAAAPATAAPWS